MWSQRVRYGIRALIGLAMEGGGRVSARSLAERYEIPRKYLEAILTDLRAAGLIHSTKGANGGHELIQNPSRVQLRSVIEAMEPDLLAPLPAAPESPGLTDVMGTIAGVLDTVSLADLVAAWQRSQNTLTWVI